MPYIIPCLKLRGLFEPGDSDGNDRAAIGVILCFDHATMRFDDLGGDRHPEPRALKLGRHERLEDVDIFGETFTKVTHRDR